MKGPMDLEARLFRADSGEPLGSSRIRAVESLQKLDLGPVPSWHLLGAQQCRVNPKSRTQTPTKSLTYQNSLDKLRVYPNLALKLVFDESPRIAKWETDRYWPDFQLVRQTQNMGLLYSDRFVFDESTDLGLGVFEYTDAESQTTLDFQVIPPHYFRLRQVMENLVNQQSQMFGEGSREQQEIEELLLGTEPKLLIGTLVFSFLHSIFEVLAFKSDLAFWQSTDAHTLNEYISVWSVVFDIVFHLIMAASFYDEGSSFLMIIFSLAQLGLSVWKVWKAWGKGQSPASTEEDPDKKATLFVFYLILPLILGYAGWQLVYQCFPSWTSYLIRTSAATAHGVAFVFMTPQLFINYRKKSVAHLPWKMFVYKAINTFVDDLFSFIITMPTLHRLGCFKDDLIFVVYMYQRWIYREDYNRRD